MLNKHVINAAMEIIIAAAVLLTPILILTLGVSGCLDQTERLNPL